MNIHECMTTNVFLTSPQETIRDDAFDRDVKSELVDFLVHQAFYPVLMAQRSGPNRAMVEQLQDATRTEISRFRNCKSAEEVIINFMNGLQSQQVKTMHSDLKSLNLPVLEDVRNDFEQKAHELGLEPKTLLTAPYYSSNTGGE